MADVAIIGAGRLGHGLALALTRRERKSVLFGREWEPTAVREAPVVLLAVPDAAITPLAAALASRAAIQGSQAVLHLSGLFDREALAPLVATGAALGSFHPLQTIADPATAPERLEGAYVGIEGDPRALEVARDLATILSMKAVVIPPGAKAVYHAGATLVSNYTVTLLGLAERLAVAAGIQENVAGEMYLPLLRGTIANLAMASPAQALTGPVRRGDVETVRAHLAVLSPSERSLYCDLALATLDLAIEAGLDRTKAAQVQELLSRSS